MEQITLSFADQAWEEIRDQLRARIEQDVRAELTNIAAQFRRNVIGAPGNQRGLVGRLATKSPGGPSMTLGGLPRWAPRDAEYLQRKRDGSGNIDWFDNSQWTGGAWTPAGGGTLKEFFASDSVGYGPQQGSAGVFEDVFGPVVVQVTRNNTGRGVNAGTITMDSKGQHAQMKLATVRVRALGAVTDRMMQISDAPNSELLNQFVETGNRDVALRLRGGRGRYRPALEPYLKFFLQQALPHAVNARIQKGIISGTVFKNAMRR